MILDSSKGFQPLEGKSDVLASLVANILYFIYQKQGIDVYRMNKSIFLWSCHEGSCQKEENCSLSYVFSCKGDQEKRKRGTMKMGASKNNMQKNHPFLFSSIQEA